MASGDAGAGKLRRFSLAAHVAFWAVLLVVAVTGAGRMADRTIMTALGGLGLSAAAARAAWSGSWSPWGSLPVYLAMGAGLLWTLWAGNWWGLAPVAWGLAALALVDEWQVSRPDDGPKLAAVVLAGYLALAPAVDGLLLGPPEPPSMEVTGGPYVEASSTRTSMAADEGRLFRAELTAAGLPPVDLVSGTLREGVDRTGALEATFREANATGPSFVFPFPPFLAISSSRETQVQNYSGDWQVVSLDARETTTSFLFFFQTTEGHRQVLVLQTVDREHRFHLVPPFVSEWDRFAGYRFHRSGDNPAALDGLDGNVTVEGQTLDAPEAVASELEPVGEYRRDTPGLGLFAVAAVLAGVALARGRRSAA